MTYTFKLSRRLAVSRGITLLSGMLLLAACEDSATSPDDSTHGSSTPLADTSSVSVDTSVVHGDTLVITVDSSLVHGDSLVVTVDTSVVHGARLIAPAPTPAPPPVVAASVGTGVPFGPFHLPNDQFGAHAWYTGALRALAPSSAARDLAAATAQGIRLVVSLPSSRGNYTNSDKTFNLSMWKKQMDKWKSSTALLQAYYANGTIVGNYLVDEPHCAGCWGGKTISYAALEEMGRYAKTIAPSLPTIVRTTPGWLRHGKYTFHNVDLAWAQYEGRLHYPSAGMTAEQFRDQSVVDAKALGMGLIMGMNTLDGGDGSSKISGTFNLKTVKTRWQMSAAEVEHAGTVFAKEPYVCAVLDWRFSSTMETGRYTSAQFAGIKGFENRADVRAALTKVRVAAASHATNACK